MSLIGPPNQDALEKLFVDDLSAGWVASFDESDGAYVAFLFDLDTVPFVGLAINRDGWPFDGSRVCTLIVEPCSGWPDRLDEAIDHGAYIMIPGHEQRQWSVDLLVGQGKDHLKAALGQSQG